MNLSELKQRMLPGEDVFFRRFLHVRFIGTSEFMYHSLTVDGLYSDSQNRQAIAYETLEGALCACIANIDYASSNGNSLDYARRVPLIAAVDIQDKIVAPSTNIEGSWHLIDAPTRNTLILFSSVDDYLGFLCPNHPLYDYIHYRMQQIDEFARCLEKNHSLPTLH